MNKIVAATLFVFLSCTVQAQFGIKAGLNFANLKGNADADFNTLTNFHIGGVYEVSIFDHLSLQPELVYSVQGAKVDDEELKLNYFNVPVLLKFYLNDGFNIHAGPQMGMLLSESDYFERFDTNTFDFGFTGGLEFFISDGLFAQARYYAGTNQVIDNPDLKNTMIQVSLGYVF